MSPLHSSFVYSVYSVVHISLRTLRPCDSALKHLHLLPKVPAEAGETVKEAELEEIAEAEIGNGTEIKNHPIDTQFSKRSKKPVTHLNLRITSACENWKLGWREFAAYARRTRAAFATAGCEFLKSRMVCNNCS